MQCIFLSLFLLDGKNEIHEKIIIGKQPSPVDSIRLAVLTVSPNRQYRGIFVPTMPATTGPVWQPHLIWSVSVVLQGRKSNKIYRRTKRNHINAIKRLWKWTQTFEVFGNKWLRRANQVPLLQFQTHAYFHFWLAIPRPPCTSRLLFPLCTHHSIRFVRRRLCKLNLKSLPPKNRAPHRITVFITMSFIELKQFRLKFYLKRTALCGNFSEPDDI